MTRRRPSLVPALIALVLLAALSLAGASTSAGATSPVPGPSALAPDAPPPPVITYQGRLVDPTSGEPKPDGSYTAAFKIHDAATGGSVLFEEKQNIQTNRGLFSVTLGSQAGNAIDPALFDGYGRWLSIAIDPDGELSPRIRIASAPYAIWSNLAQSAGNADRLGSNLPAFYLNASNTNAGTLGIAYYHAIDDLSAEGYLGNASGDLALNNGSIQSTLNADLLDGFHAASFALGTHNHDASYVNSTGDSMSGMLGVSIPSTGSHGISATTASTAWGAAGVEAKNTGAGYGLNAYSANSNAVRAVASGSGAAIYGGNDSTSGGIGVHGESTNSIGVYAYSANSNALSATGAGTSAAVQVTNNNASGGYGLSVSSSKSRAVYGAAGGDAGIYGYASNGTTGYGVYGYSTATTSGYAGIGGYAAGGSGEVYGVKGSCNTAGNPSCYAAYFTARVHVNGALTKASGAFKIDHPLDPENKYLYHSFVESPDMMNVYNGNVVLDEQGEAWVQLPDWFEALNKDFRYQLTAIGGPGPNLYIAQKVQDNRFQVAGGSPGLEVSWQVTGIRHDAFADANRIPVAEDKPASERGTFLHPEVYGKPASSGRDYQPAQVPAPAAPASQ